MGLIWGCTVASSRCPMAHFRPLRACHSAAQPQRMPSLTRERQLVLPVPAAHLGTMRRPRSALCLPPLWLQRDTQLTLPCLQLIRANLEEASVSALRLRANSVVRSSPSCLGWPMVHPDSESDSSGGLRTGATAHPQPRMGTAASPGETPAGDALNRQGTTGRLKESSSWWPQCSSRAG